MQLTVAQSPDNHHRRAIASTSESVRKPAKAFSSLEGGGITILQGEQYFLVGQLSMMHSEPDSDPQKAASGKKQPLIGRYPQEVAFDLRGRDTDDRM